MKATNDDGSDTATSNPTAIITSAKPFNTTEPSISGTAVVGNVLNANRGQWGGDAPITYSFVWLRCSAKGDNCGEIQAATDNQYQVVANDVGRTIRVRVIARNDQGSTSAISNPTGVVGSNQPPPPPPGSSVAVGDLKAAGDRLVIASVQFSPNPVTSRTAPITVRVRVTARGGRPVNGALVFMRGTPRVVSGQTQATQADGYVTLTLVPNELFPQPRNGFNVQFFLKGIGRAIRGSAASRATGSCRSASPGRRTATTASDYEEEAATAASSSSLVSSNVTRFKQRNSAPSDDRVMVR